MLLISGVAYLGGRYFDNKQDKIEGDGITAMATVYDATYDKLVSFLQGNVDNETNRMGYQRSDSDKCTIYYRFETLDGQQIEGSVNRDYASLEAAKSEIGTEFEVIYSATDPTVFETRQGNTSG